MPGAQVAAMKAGKAAFRNAPIGGRKAAGQAAMESIYLNRGKRPGRMGLIAGGAMAAGAMRPGPMSQQTGYSGPRPMTNAPSGSGRYA